MPIEEKIIKVPDYSEAEKSQRSDDMYRMRRARDMRDMAHPQFDDRGYIDWYKANDKASYTYNPPKQNDSDKRIVSGITNDKVITLTSHFLNFNFKADVEAYDETQSNVIFINRSRLGNHIEDMLKKQEELENFEDKLGAIYTEAFTQGDAFVETVEEAEITITKILKNKEWRKGEKITMEDLAYEETNEFKSYSKVVTNMISGLNFFHGNIYEQSIEKQPYIVLRKLLSYADTKAMWGNFERFEFVPTSLVEMEDQSEWLVGDYREGYVEQLIVQDKPKNTIQIYLNGVAMLPVGFPLSAINGVNEYTVTKLSTEPRYGFAYSKGQVAKIRVNHSLIDIFLRAFVQKTEQSIKPPMGNNTDTQYSVEVFNAGNIIPDISKDDFFPIIDTPGVTQSEMKMMELLKSIVDQDSVSPIFQGQSLKGSQTLGEIQKLEAQTAKSLGYAFLGITQFHRRLDWKKIYTILTTWTQPIDTRLDGVTGEIKNTFRKINIQTEDQGMQTEKIISFKEGEIPEEQQERAMSALLSEARGRRVQIAHLNVEELRTLKYYFYVTTTPTEKDTSELRAARFEESMMKALQIFPALGKQLNVDYLSDRWAHHNNEDPEKLFLEAPNEQIGAQQVLGEQGQPSPISGQLQQKQPQQPSLNTLINQ